MDIGYDDNDEGEILSDKNWIRHLSSSLFGSTDWVFKRRLNQFRGNLEAICEEIIQNNEIDNDKMKCINDIQEEIKNLKSWANAFAVEQSLVHFMDDYSAASELKRRRAEIDRFSPNLNAHYQFEIRNELRKDPLSYSSIKRLLFRLVKDIQWHDLNLYHRHIFVSQITQRVNLFFILSIIAFLLTSMLFFYGFIDIRFGFFIIAIISGIFGASFSMLTSLEKRIESTDIDELRSIRSWPSLLTRIFAGGGGGLIFYLFILSGVVTVDGLPQAKFLSEGVATEKSVVSTEEAVSNGDGASKDNLNELLSVFALFVLFSFIAGFAEKLVPGLIGSATEKFDRDKIDSADAKFNI